jgi:hypothetical protein
MITILRTLCAAGVTCAALASPSEAFAASLGVVLTEEGFPSCNSFAVNDDLLQLQKDRPGASFSLADEDGQEITATVTDDHRLAWEATIPVNVVIVAGRRPVVDDLARSSEDDDHDREFRSARSLVYLFGAEGTTFDNDETAPDSAEIKRVRFCYGLSEDFEEEEVARCEDIPDGPQCPLDGEEERNGVLVFFDFDERNFGVERDDNQCACGDLEPIGCAEGAAADEEGACAGNVLQEIPVLVEGIKNPASTICTTVDGKRVCKRTRSR